MIMLDKDEIFENFAEYLLPYQRAFTYSESYKAMVQAFINFLEANEKESKQKHMEFQHAKEIFSHLCETAPEGIKEKEYFQNKQTNKTKEQLLNKLYEQHKNEILKG